MTDNVNHPQHYLHYKREVIELTSLLDFTLGNAVKYILRAPFKGNTEEDLAKACWYLNHEHTRKYSVVPTKVFTILSDYDSDVLTELLNTFPSVYVEGERRDNVDAVLDKTIAKLLGRG
jgi:hypothetical protein